MMSKKNAIILILTVFLGTLAALVWFYFNSTGSQTVRTITTTVSDDNTYNPFGITPTSSSDTATSQTGNETVTASVPLLEDVLRQFSVEPESGYMIIEDKQTKQTKIHYILRSNGNIYEAYADSPEIRRLSITTVPKVYESAWLPDGERLIIRYLRDLTENVQTFSVRINPATTTLNTFEGGITGNHLSENIGGLAVNPAGDKIYYMINGLSGASGYVAKPDGSDKKLLFESPFTEWLVSWPKDDTITMNTKPSAKFPGYLYFLNSKTGAFTKILGNIKGLTSVTNASSTKVLYSDESKGWPQLYLYDVKKGESKLLPFKTFPEKCAWSRTDGQIIYCAVPKSFAPGLDYPDAWYQGLTNFTDDIWSLNTETLAQSLVYDIQSQTGNNIDVTDPQLDKGDSFFFFTNKEDLTLWSLRLR